MKLLNVSYRVVLTVFTMAIMAGCSDRGGKSHTEAGIRKLRNDEYSSAVKLFREAISRNPGNAAAYCNLGIAYWKMGEHQRALGPFEKAAELNPEDPLPFEFRGLIYTRMQEWDMARRSFYSALRRSRDSAEIVTYLAMVELKNSNTMKGQLLLKRALEIDEEYGPALYNLGVLYSHKAESIPLEGISRDPERAAQYLQRYVEVGLNPERVEKASNYLKEIQLVTGPRPPVEEPEARAATSPAGPEEETEPGKPSGPEPERTAGINPVILDVRKALARHEYDKALVLLNRSIEENPDDPDLLWELAIVYDRYLEYAEKAQSIYEKFARRFPDDPRTETVQEGEDEPELLAGVDRRRKPQEALDEWAQGLRFHQAGDIDEAVKQYKKALALDSQCFNAAYNLGLAYRHRKQYGLASKALKKALEIKPESAKAVYMLGVAYWEQEDYPHAVEYLNRALRLKPDYADAHFVLGLVHNDRGRNDLAKSHFQHCARLAEGSDLGKRAREWLDYLAR